MSTSNKVRHLLSGIATCADCGGPVRGTACEARGGVFYRCTEKGCRKIWVRVERVDELAAAHAIARLQEIDMSGTLVSDRLNVEIAEAQTALDAIPDKRANYARLHATEAIDDAALSASMGALSERERELRATVARLQGEAAAPIHALDGATGPNAARVWAGWARDTTGAGLARQRAVIALLLDIRLSPLGRGNHMRKNPRTVDDCTSITYRPLGA